MAISPRLQIRLLGEFYLSYNCQSVASINADRLQSLLAYLLLHRHTPQPRQQLAVQLWTEVTESEARTNLRRRLHDLRRLLPDSARFLVVSPKTIQWQLHAPFILDVVS